MVLAQPSTHGDGVWSWIESLAAKIPLGGKGRAVINVLTSQPRLASYASVREIAAIASLSSGTVTRTAQALGFTGWPNLQAELRTHYLASLSAVELAEVRVGDSQLPAFASITRDRENLNAYSRAVDLSQIERVARAMTRARRTFVVGGGSFMGVGRIFAHSAQLHGYDVRLLDEPAQLVNVLSTVTSDVVVFGISFWRLYESTDDHDTCGRSGLLPLAHHRHGRRAVVGGGDGRREPRAYRWGDLTRRSGVEPIQPHAPPRVTRENLPGTLGRVLSIRIGGTGG